MSIKKWDLNYKIIIIAIILLIALLVIANQLLDLYFENYRPETRRDWHNFKTIAGAVRIIISLSVGIFIGMLAKKKIVLHGIIIGMLILIIGLGFLLPTAGKLYYFKIARIVSLVATIAISINIGTLIVYAYKNKKKKIIFTILSAFILSILLYGLISSKVFNRATFLSITEDCMPGMIYTDSDLRHYYHDPNFWAELFGSVCTSF